MVTTAEISRNGTFPDTSHKQRFEQAVVQAAATMDNPPYNDNNGKLRKAMDLALASKVQAHADGLYSVKGSTKTYDIDGECPCPQGQGQASKWCKHLVAVEIWKRANEILYPEIVNGYANGHSNGNSNGPQVEAPVVGSCSILPDHADQPNPPAPQPTLHDSFPESTICVRDVIAGREVSWTLRGTDDEAASRLQRVMSFLDSLKESAPEPQPTAEHWCSEHKTPFKHNSNAKGTWYSHRLADGSWCKEK